MAKPPGVAKASVKISLPPPPLPGSTFGRFVVAEGISIEYCHADRNQRATLVFINGCGNTYSIWKNQFNLPGFDLLFMNPRGMGRSNTGKLDPDTYLLEYAHDVERLCRHLRIDSVHLVAHSLGGLVPPQIIARSVRGESSLNVRSVTFLSAITSNPVRTFPFARVFDLIAPERLAEWYGASSLPDYARNSELFGRVAYAAIVRGFRLGLSREDFYRIYRGFLKRDVVSVALESTLRHGDRIGELMREITVPALVIGCNSDVLVGVDAARVIHERISGSEMIVFDGINHGAMFECPDRFNLTLLRFLGRVERDLNDANIDANTVPADLRK